MGPPPGRGTHPLHANGHLRRNWPYYFLRSHSLIRHTLKAHILALLETFNFGATALEQRTSRYARDRRTTMPTQPPLGWGKDDLSSFIDLAKHNIFGSYTRFRPIYKRLVRIDQAYRNLVNNLSNTPDFRSALFLLGAHSSFLGGTRLSLSGQTTEAYRVLRGCIENALYGLHVAGDTESFKKWLRRHDSQDSMRNMRREFAIRQLLRELETQDTNAHMATVQLYERTIDYGAHPNERAFSSNMRISEGPTTVQIDLRYLTADPTQLEACIRSTAQIGVCSLDIFRIVFRERFDITGLSDTLKKLKNGL